MPRKKQQVKRPQISKRSRVEAQRRNLVGDVLAQHFVPTRY